MVIEFFSGEVVYEVEILLVVLVKNLVCVVCKVVGVVIDKVVVKIVCGVVKVVDVVGECKVMCKCKVLLLLG